MDEPNRHPTCAGVGLKFDLGCDVGLNFYPLISSLVAGGFFSTPPNLYHPTESLVECGIVICRLGPCSVELDRLIGSSNTGSSGGLTSLSFLNIQHQLSLSTISFSIVICISLHHPTHNHISISHVSLLSPPSASSLQT
jgi:hypothetical protein